MGRLYAYRDKIPRIADTAVLFDSAEITGDVVVGEGSIIGAGVKIIGDCHGPVRIGARVVAAKLFDPGLSPGERAFLEALEPAFSELVGTSDQTLYIGGAGALVSEMRYADVAQINQLMRALEERVGLLEVLRGALDSERLFLRIGSQTGLPEMQGLSLVAANYGLVTRNLGTVSLIGPTRMDYTFAIRSVRGAAAALSEFVEDVYDG